MEYIISNNYYFILGCMHHLQFANKRNKINFIFINSEITNSRFILQSLLTNLPSSNETFVIASFRLSNIFFSKEIAFNKITMPSNYTSFGKKILKLHHDYTKYYSTLTPREKIVCSYIQQKYSPKSICIILNISEKTVSTHIVSIMRKLGCSNKIFLYKWLVIYFCLSRGMIFLKK